MKKITQMQKRLFSIFIIFYSSSLIANSRIKDLNVYIYSEYYFSGVMVEINGKVELSDSLFSMKMLVPSITDSVFFVLGTSDDQSEVQVLDLNDENSMKWVDLNLTKSSFRIFVFYNPFNSSIRRNVEYPLQFTTSLGEFHVFIQEPLVSTNFNIDLESTSNKDQHNIIFHQIHFQKLTEMSKEVISFSYDNPSFKTTMQLLQERLSDSSDNKNNISESKKIKIPVRHRLPLWEPFAVLGVLSFLVGFLFLKYNKYENHHNNCSKCGNKLKNSDKYCSTCGGKI